MPARGSPASGRRGLRRGRRSRRLGSWRTTRRSPLGSASSWRTSRSRRTGRPSPARERRHRAAPRRNRGSRAGLPAPSIQPWPGSAAAVSTAAQGDTLTLPAQIRRPKRPAAPLRHSSQYGQQRMEPYLWLGAMVKARLWFAVCGVTSVFASRGAGRVGCARAPGLTWVRGRRVRRQDDRSGVNPWFAFAVARS
jgi:hypothetical protein